MKPICHISLGRSGTTLAMRLLSSHPDVVANEGYPLEFRPMWSALDPSDEASRSCLSLPQYRFDGWEDTVGKILQDKGKLEAGDIVEIYRRLSLSKQKRAAYFAEKIPRNSVEIIKNQFPGAIYSCTIRDPRDLLVSVLAFNRKRGYSSFLARDGGRIETIVDNYKRAYNDLIEDISLSNASVLKYEDFYSFPEGEIEKFYRKLGLDSGTKIIAGAWKRAQSMEDGGHRTSVYGSTGRWRSELPPDVQDLYRDRLGHILTYFDYPLV